MDSVAEAELLSQLAVMLMPNTPMEELFRSFPSPEGWGGHSLAPDLAVHGVLKDKDAALFVEYDGDWRHGKNEGMERDDRKNEALLAYAPSGSFIVRISHTRKTRFRDNILWVSVDTWSRGDDGSLLKRLRTILRQFLWHSESRLQPRTSRVLRTWVQSNSNMLSMEGKNFASTAAAEAAGNTLEEIISFLTTEGFTAKEIQHLQTHRILYGRSRSIEKRLQPTIRWLGNIGLTSTEVTKLLTTLPILDRSVEQGLHPKRQWLLDLGFSTTEAKKVILKHPSMLGCSIEENLKPTRQWLLDLGFSTTEAKKIILKHPQIFGYSIEENLKPTRQWLLDLGFSTTEAKKVILKHPSMLGCSIEENLKPTRQWLLDLGFSTTEAKKIILKHPQLLGCSIEENLKPTRQWLLDLGFSTTEANKVILKLPPILGCSIEENLKPTRQWLLDLGFSTTEANKVILQFPSILGCSIEKNLKPTRQWLLDLGLSTTQAKKVILIKPQIFGYSIKQSLKPTRQWLLDLGFSTTEAKKIILKHPPILGYSIEKNLEYKMCLLKSLMVAQKLVDWVARYPKIFSYSYKRLKQRLGILFAANRSEEFIQGLIVNDEDFRSRYMDGPMALDAVPS